MAELTAEEQAELSNLRAIRDAAPSVSGLTAAEQVELEQLRALSQQAPAVPVQEEGFGPRLLSQLGRGFTGGAGLIGDIVRTPARLASEAGTGLASLVTGAPTEDIKALSPRGPIGQVIEAPFGALTESATEIIPLEGREPRNAAERAAELIAQNIGGAVSFGGGVGPAAKLGRQVLLPSVTGGISQAGAEIVAPENEIAQAIAGVAGGLAPEAARGLARGAVKKLGRTSFTQFNKPAGIARRIGAGKGALTLDKKILSADEAVDVLLDVSPRFRQEVASTGSSKKLESLFNPKNSKSIVNRVGKEIGDILENNKAVKISVNEINQHPDIFRLRNLVAATDNISEQEQRAAKRVLRELDRFIGERESVDLIDLWKQRKAFDQKSFSKAGTQLKSGEKALEVRGALQDIIEDGVSKAVESGSTSPDDLDRLLTLNREFSALKTIQPEVLGRAGAEKGKSFVQKLKDRISIREALFGAGLAATSGAATGSPVAGGALGLGGMLALEASEAPEVGAALFRIAEGPMVSPDIARQVASSLAGPSVRLVEE